MTWAKQTWVKIDVGKSPVGKNSVGKKDVGKKSVGKTPPTKMGVICQSSRHSLDFIMRSDSVVPGSRKGCEARSCTVDRGGG